MYLLPRRCKTLNIFDGNISRLQNEGNQINVLHFPPKNRTRDLYFPGTADETREQF